MVYKPTPNEASSWSKHERVRNGPQEHDLRLLLKLEETLTDGYWFWWMSEEGPWSVCANEWIDPTGERGRAPMRRVADAVDTHGAQLVCVMRNTVPTLLAELEQLRAENKQLHDDKNALALARRDLDDLVYDLEGQIRALREELCETLDLARSLREQLVESQLRGVDTGEARFYGG